jgi:hypothetical protein
MASILRRSQPHTFCVNADDAGVLSHNGKFLSGIGICRPCRWSVAAPSEQNPPADSPWRWRGIQQPNLPRWPGPGATNLGPVNGSVPMQSGAR